ncbi:MAG: radical SAM protein [Chloroflexota bacterium]|jgi:wyosine [tRNA(Phe)-imidazoG37] synthetase (radical SAM superfamily)
MRTIYGPVETAQFGRVLGVDMVASQRKFCSFDCVYCNTSKRTHGISRRRQFVGNTWIQAILEREIPFDADYVVFSGMGEPTLASNLGEAIDLVKSLLKLPVAVLTNSSLIPRDDVRRDLKKADLVVAKLDAPNEDLFKRINRPFVPYSLDEILAGLEQFRAEYNGRLALQSTFLPENRAFAAELAAIAQRISPTEVQLNTPLDCPTMLAQSELERIRDGFTGLKTTSVFESRRPVARPFSLAFPPLRPNAGVMLMCWST